MVSPRLILQPLEMSERIKNAISAMIQLDNLSLKNIKKTDTNNENNHRASSLFGISNTAFMEEGDTDSIKMSLKSFCAGSLLNDRIDFRRHTGIPLGNS